MNVPTKFVWGEGTKNAKNHDLKLMLCKMEYEIVCLDCGGRGYVYNSAAIL